ncbi:MAG TPA: ATP-binding cassette domain-containing protein [Saprospiraceae bacterium]|nr:ATP-binding cassette domain-containing protein [Saprospiraceae bacterium]HNA63646.1 ATP-binding cassette domain-containing protein [Saprospiraceae bacterium]HNE61469.1 ATP-binding cassette domain-containing protein [Saprospiraceae bacterium]HNG67995.1 ATP-binding cassette domain-containing protein [Saprospiraceae bacterium]HNI78260.1 ATP-binding cassette domain-containing protein [Saprospiraceae bacterium]
MDHNPLLIFEAAQITAGTSFALRNINLRIGRGDWVEITGHNRSGKSVLLKSIFGLLPVSVGTLHCMGINFGHNDQIQSVRRKIGIVADAVPLIQGRTLRANFSLASAAAGVARDLTQTEFFNATLEAFKLSAKMQELSDDLSASEQWLARTARALMTEPDLLLLDCPLRMLDEAAAMVYLRLIRSYMSDTQRAVIWCTDHLNIDAPAHRRVMLLENQTLRELNR